MQTTKRFVITLAGILLAFAVAPLVIASVHFQHLLIMLLLYTTLSQAWNLIGVSGRCPWSCRVFRHRRRRHDLEPGADPVGQYGVGAVISVIVR
jgi:hypothetical protein